MTAALKMSAPGELCAHSKKLMAFCQTTVRSLKAMRQHIGVTRERMDTLLRDMLEQRLIWKQSNGMYKTCTNKLQFLDEQPAANSLQFKAMAMQGGVKRAEVRIKAPIQSKDKKGRPRISKSWMLFEPGRDYELKGGL